MSLAEPDTASICLGGPGSGGELSQSPGGADKQPVGLEMDSPEHLSNAPMGKKSELPLPQEHRQPTPHLSPTVAWGQPSAQSEGQQPQTQDWVSWTPGTGFAGGGVWMGCRRGISASGRAERCLVGGSQSISSLPGALGGCQGGPFCLPFWALSVSAGHFRGQYLHPGRGGQHRKEGAQ